MANLLKGLYILDEKSFNVIYGPDERRDIEKLVDICGPLYTEKTIRENLSVLQDIDVIFSGWGAPKLDEEFMNAAPNLKAVFYGAGSIKHIVTDAFWDRDIVITSAYAANAIPVSEYTLSQILFSLKRGWYYMLYAKEHKRHAIKQYMPGAYGSTVGLISLGMIGRRVCELLKPFDVDIIAYDPYVSELDAEKLGVKLVSLDDIFKQSDVVSLHTPWLKETEGMITGRHFSEMKEYSTFINTSRGAIVKEDEMIEVLKKRPDIFALLDVTYPEPPVEGSPLYTLPNVVLTPHIAGSLNNECRRMGRYMVEELQRFIDGQDLKWQITRQKAQILA